MPDPFIWLEFNDHSGTTAVDRSGSGLNGTVNGSPVWTTSALSFDGASNYVLVTGSSFPIFQTIAVWVKFGLIGSGENSMIVERDDDSSDWGLALEMSDSHPRVNYQNTIVSGGNLTGSSSLSNGVLYFLVISWDGTNLRLYVNGVEDASSPAAFTGTMRGAATHYTFGGLGLTGGRFFNGAMEDAKIYARVLSAVEIATLYNAGPGTPAISPMGQMAQ